MWWFILENEVPQPAMSPVELGEAIQSGRVGPDTLVATDRDPDWKPAREYADLKNHFPNAGVFASPAPVRLQKNTAPPAVQAAAAESAPDPFPAPLPLFKPFTAVAEPAPAPYFQPAGDPEPEADSDDGAIDSELKTCPHCWHRFPLSRALYIAQHPSLYGDDVVQEGQKRFLPTRFDADGNAVDAEGMSCPDMACPRCHLRIPPTAIDLETRFYSIIGAPASGKTYFLTSLIHRLRQDLSLEFDISITDADPVGNLVLAENENRLFMSPEPDKLTALDKTQMTGDLYDSVLLGGREINLPKPFIYKLHAQWAPDTLSRDWNVVFYDNAGEHFQPGSDDFNNPGTRHLAHSNGIIFLFDPTVDPRFRRKLNLAGTEDDSRIRVQNQETLLAETLARLRRYRVLDRRGKYPHPFIVAVSKFDEWRGLCPLALADMSPVHRDAENLISGCNGYIIDNISYHTRNMLLEYSPGFVQALEDAASDVVYLPNSALGCAAERDPASGAWGVLPAKLNPVWVEAPFLVFLMRQGVIPEYKRQADGQYLVIDRFTVNEDYLFFNDPVSGKRVRLPRSFAGKLINDPAAGCRFVVPGADDAAESDGADATDAFWERL